MFHNAEAFGRNLRIFCGVMGAVIGLCTEPYSVNAATSGMTKDGKGLPQDTSDDITLTVQWEQFFGATNNGVAGGSIVLPQTEVSELHSYIKTNGEKVVFLHKGKNIAYLSKVIRSKDKKTGLTHIDLVPGTIETGILGASTATRLPNGSIKIDVTVTDINLVDMPDCSDVQCPVTVGRQTSRTVALSPDQAETIDLPLSDNNDQSIRLIFSRKQRPSQVKQTVSGMSNHRA
ncbi:hypothetical protein GOB86_14655 [Acetobacter lambici]|uniref:Uncharacterized protein n=2 Tax=Acetobacter lambici TaxID=1332824 RepID=A0ABT1F489_9PROT|nr:hypothetical protein [Acetobacter lambici]MCP1260035.1 hypothetical protein [Acetobacter lambici]NHO58253.1 hypothetical protein [Acetobacter lambici]